MAERSPSGRASRYVAESRADTCDSREIRRTTPWESPRTSGCLRLRAAFSLGSGQSSRVSSHRRGGTSPTWRCGCWLSVSAHRVCQKQLSGRSLFSLILREIQYPKFSAVRWVKTRLRPSRVLLFPFAFPSRPKLGRFKIAPRPGQAEPGDASERYRTLPMGRRNNAPRNRGMNRYRGCCGRSICVLKNFPHSLVSLHFQTFGEILR